MMNIDDFDKWHKKYWLERKEITVRTKKEYMNIGWNAAIELMQSETNNQLDQLKAFVNEVISDTCEGGGYDGGELQKIMIKHGLLIPTMVYENCGEYCACSENCTTEEFENGEVECYRKAEFLK